MADDKEYATPARYRVLDASFIHDTVRESNNPHDGNRFSGRVYQAGEEVMYSGHPGSNLEPLDDEGRQRREHYLKSKGISAAKVVSQKEVLTKGGPDVDGNLSRLAGEGGPLAKQATNDESKPPAPVPIPPQDPAPVNIPGSGRGHRSS